MQGRPTRMLMGKKKHFWKKKKTTNSKKPQNQKGLVSFSLTEEKEGDYSLIFKKSNQREGKHLFQSKDN